MKKRLLSLMIALFLFFIPEINFGQAPDLGTAANYVLFSSIGALGNTGISQLTGNVGTNNGACTTFGNVNGVMNVNNGASAQCATDLLAAYNILNNTTASFFPAPLLGNGDTLIEGVYSISGAATLNLSLTLDAKGNSNAVFVFLIQGSFSTNSDAKVKLINGAQACKVFWKVEGLVSMASGTTMRGTIIANNGAINMNAGDTLEGRALSTAGAISVSGVLAYIPTGCGSPVLSGPAAPVLGTAACYGIFSSTGTVSNTGVTSVTGDIGTNSGLTTGYDALLVTGIIHPIPDISTAQCMADLLIAYDYVNTLTSDIELLYPAQFGRNLVLTPHTYLMNGAASLTDTLYLNAKGNANAVFVIKINGAFSTSTFSKVILTNGTNAKNVFWKVEGSVNINDYSVFNGTIICNNGAISLYTGASVNGRVLTTSGALSTAAASVIIPSSCASTVSDTKVVIADCGSTVNTLAKYIYCDYIPGATDYEWEFTSGSFSFTRTRGSFNTGFYLAWVTGIQYSTIYDVRVRAFKNNLWGNFSTVCQVTTSAIPATKVKSSYCGITVANLTQYIYCDAVVLATNYEWEFTNAADGYIFTRTRGNSGTSMSLSWITGLESGKAYMVKVRAQVGTQWGIFSTACEILTPSIPIIKLQPIYCGTTIASLSNYFYCDAVSGAVDFEWEFTNSANNFSVTVVRGIGSNSMSLAYVNGISLNTTYNVRVRVKLGTQWGEFGSACQITTPGVSLTKVRADFCGSTVISLKQFVYCDAVKGATDYEWKFENQAVGFSFSKARLFANTGMNLSWITGIENNMTYNVSVRAQVAGTWGSFGDICQITTPSGVRLQNNDANKESKLEVRGSNLELPTSNLELSSYPNPVQNGKSFTVSIKSNSNLSGTIICIYNIIGQVIFTQKINADSDNYSLNITQTNKFTSGIFIIQSELNGEIKRIKLIVE